LRCSIYVRMYIGMKVHAKLALANDADEEFCGAGVLQLLEGIARRGSIQGAAQDMALSYVKALKILNRLERELGETLLVRHKGGAARGSTELTPLARRFARDFAKARGRAQRAAESAFAKVCRKYGGGVPPKVRGAR
jgi:molybdate transport system regulatory protein